MFNTIFIALGILILIAKLSNYQRIREIVSIVNKEKRGVVITEYERKRIALYCCMPAIFYIWLFIGFVTTEWLLCLCWLFMSTIEFVCIADKPSKLWRCKMRIALDAIFIIAALSNIIAIHFDVPAYIQSLIFNN